MRGQQTHAPLKIKEVALAKAFSCCDQREPKPSTSCTLLLEAAAFTRMTYAHAGSSIRM